jgi:aryl-alcohol dehydrogenase-like predicted oxidoreductase
MDQPQYNMLIRDRVEREYLPVYKEFGYGLTTWSPLATGILTGMDMSCGITAVQTIVHTH